ncbi:MAG TPA: alkaline phosphatase family protein, partial [Polyangiaceae bacterium]|nr:alkaline phosphatase family protein [Polyangiaceae bacterium]
MVALVLPLSVAAACSSSSSPSQSSGGDDGGSVAESGVTPDGGGDAPATAKVEHLVVIVQENQTFDSYFGRWCTGATNSMPTCTQGPSCCEAGPGLDPGSTTTPATLNDAFNAARDPNHAQACELSEIDGGKMDGFVTSSLCGSALNFAYADTTVQSYWSLAAKSALADHYFQPVAGQSTSNDMYLARARFVLLDNQYEPQAIGASCSLTAATMQYTDTTIADLLVQAGVTWSWYGTGYDAMKQAQASGGTCPPAPADCPFGQPTYPCVYDPSDDPFAYYPNFVDKPAYFKDYTQLATDLSGGNLPAVSYVKAIGYDSEHPGYGDTVSAGVAFVGSTIAAIEASSYAPSTLILVTWDEGGGHFDHVTPPPVSTVDNQPYGTRVPLLAVGPLAGVGVVSHVTMEHSSIVKFIEYNWLGGKTGQLQGRDAVVAN